MTEIDYSKLGLKCGIEIHQQLDTDHKLFCSCRNSLSDDKPFTTITRKLRPVAGETGDVDPAALHERLIGMSFVYNAYPGESCLVEIDSEPPHALNREALDITLTIGMMMDCVFPDEIHMMRKNVIDGSNTAGFQRTAIVGLDGGIGTSFGDVSIANLCLEEEACQILGREKGKVFYGLDRLGIPLVEIGTGPDIRSPEQAREVAEKLGMIVRSTGKVKRGLGTIRQDINISIKGGARVEIKGAQDLKLIPKLVSNEVERQRNLLKIRTDLRKSSFKKIKPRLVHVSHIFRESESKITKGKTTYSILVPRFRGFLSRKLTPTRTLGNEIANYVRVKSGMKGIIHSDEDLGKYNLSGEFDTLSEQLEAKKGDCLIIAVGEKKAVKKTMDIVAERINHLVSGVPEETRRAMENGDTEYMRPLPGSARIYPETDIPPIKITGEKKKIRQSLPELIEVRRKKEKKEMKKHGISGEIIKQIVNSGRKKMFDDLVGLGFKPSLVATLLTSTLRNLEKKKGIDITRLETGHFKKIFRAMKRGKITRDSIPGILAAFAKNPGISIDKAVEKTGVKTLSDDAIREIIKKMFEENEDLFGEPRGEKVILGLVMQRVRGKADARKVMDMVRKEFEKSSPPEDPLV